MQSKTVQSLHPVIVNNCDVFSFGKICMCFVGKANLCKAVLVLKALELQLGDQESSLNSMKVSKYD